MKRLILPAIVFIAALAITLPQARALPQHGDERQYAWKAWYFSGLLLRLDFHRGETFTDPGFNPYVYWSLAEPPGSHWIYAAMMRVFRLPPPSAPYSYTDPSLQGTETEIPAITLFPLRLSACLAAALGLALITWKLHTPGALACLAFLLIPHVPGDLARIWAEGPLLLGLALCLLAYKSRWFPFACGLTVCCKLTALGVWPVMLLPGACGAWRRWRFLAPLVIAPLIFVLLTPGAWFGGGALYLVNMLLFRFQEFTRQSGQYPGFFPTRYLLPLELAALLALSRLLAGHHRQHAVLDGQIQAR